MNRIAPHWRSALRVNMDVARDQANWRRTCGLGFVSERHAHEVGRLHGIKFATLFWADDNAPETIEAKDAFTAAQNELNFLFGRYQERT